VTMLDSAHLQIQGTGVDAQMPLSVGTSPKHYGWNGCPSAPVGQLMGSDWYSAQGYWGCPSCPWTRQDNVEDAQGCNKYNKLKSELNMAAYVRRE